MVRANMGFTNARNNVKLEWLKKTFRNKATHFPFQVSNRGNDDKKFILSWSQNCNIKQLWTYYLKLFVLS